METWPYREELILNYPFSHYWADLITALFKLAPSDKEATETIVEMLSRWEVKVADSKVYIPPSKKAHEDQVLEGIKTRTSTQSKETIPEPEKKQPAITGIPSQLEFLGKSSSVRYPKWLSETEPLNITASSSSITSYPLETLFLPNWTRTILSTALSTYRDVGSIDINEVIFRISQAEPLEKVPRVSYPVMANCVQVLVDESEALEPFFRDQSYLKSTLRRVAGKEGTQFLGFLGCPLWGVRKTKIENLSDYIPPSSGTTVLLLTDLGIARNSRITLRAGIDDWLSFANLVRRAGCSLVAFVPYPPDRWPKPLIKAVTIIQWDRKTSAITIQRLIRKTLRSKKERL